MDLGMPSVTAWADLSCVSWTLLVFFLCQPCFPCSCGQLAQIMDKRLPILVGEEGREMVQSQFWWLRLLWFHLLKQQFNIVLRLYKAFCCQRDVPTTPLALGLHCFVALAQMFPIWVRSALWMCLMCGSKLAVCGGCLWAAQCSPITGAALSRPFPGRGGVLAWLPALPRSARRCCVCCWCSRSHCSGHKAAAAAGCGSTV